MALELKLIITHHEFGLESRVYYNPQWNSFTVHFHDIDSGEHLPTIGRSNTLQGAHELVNSFVNSIIPPNSSVTI